jgi:hypothetical protein
MAATNTKTTLESLVTRYRREVARLDGAAPELEVRLQNMDYHNFAAIFEGLLAKKDARVGGATLTQMVSAIMETRQARGESQQHLRPTRIREIFFNGSTKQREQYVHKEPLMLPFRAPTAAGLTYIVALSAERPDKLGFSLDEGAVIRVKARVSFPLAIVGASELKPQLAWRLDLTITRQITGSDAVSALKNIVAGMFETKPAASPENLLEVLQLTDDANASARLLYRYEVEAEFIGPPDARDALRPADIAAAAEVILRLANPEYVREAALQAEVWRAAQYVTKASGYRRRFEHELSMKNLLPQALAITRADYRAIYPPTGLYLTDKADGQRALALVHDGRGVIASSTLLEYKRADGELVAKAPTALTSFQKLTQKATSAASASAARMASDTIVDGELVIGADGPAFHAFDVIAVAGEDVTRDGFELRLARLEEAVSILREAGIPATCKQYVRLTADNASGLELEIRGFYEAERAYATDGLIFVEPGKPYDETNNYKWKSAHDNTIDFLARRAPSAVLGKEPFIDKQGHKLYLLFVGVNPEMREALGLQWCPGYADLFGAPRGGHARDDANTGSYVPIQFAPSDAPLAYLYQHPTASPLGEIDGAIVEGRCAGGCLAAGGGSSLVAWEMIRVREDRRRELLSKRYYGNDFRTAELIWLNYVDPFPVEQLWAGAALGYFQRSKDGIYRAQTAFISFVKTRRITGLLAHAAVVVDLGIGKGQDLGRYFEAGVQNLFAVDQDRAALSELVRRKYNISSKHLAKSHPGNPSSVESASRRPRARLTTTVHVLATDLGASHATTLAKLASVGLLGGTADAVVCNLAVHYFLRDSKTVRNFVDLARGAVKLNGRVIITALFGEAVHALFLESGVATGSSWDVHEDGVLKYSLKRLYSSDALEASGQMIGVLLPFSDGGYYEEYLVNTKALVAEFEARGFRLDVSSGLDKNFSEFEARNRAVSVLLTPDDRRYLSLYGELVFARII